VFAVFGCMSYLDTELVMRVQAFARTAATGRGGVHGRAPRAGRGGRRAAGREVG